MDAPPSYAPRSRALNSSDFDTASIRSAAPSYISDAPSYHSTVPSTSTSTGLSSPRQTHPRRASAGPLQPNLNDFRSTGWSTIRSNPTARHYHSVAQRRATIASARERQQTLAATLNASSTAYKTVLENMEAEEKESEAMGLGTKGYRPLEDPLLVGEEEAERARKERLAREKGDAILVREDKRWDWLLSQMKDWDEREKSWQKFRIDLSESKTSKLSRRIGMGKRTT